VLLVVFRIQWCHRGVTGGLQSSEATTMAMAGLDQRRKHEGEHEGSQERGQSRKEAHPNATVSSAGLGKSWRRLNLLPKSRRPAVRTTKGTALPEGFGSN
jgi:hypothetical protein